ncbi:MAG: ATP-binding protein [Bradymonadia bacterium]
MAALDLPRAPDLPQWMQTLRDRYLHTDTGQFILHGNVHDVIFAGGRVWSMPDFLDAFFEPSGKLVVHFDPGKGVYFPKRSHAVLAARALVEANMIRAAATSDAALVRALDDALGMERDAAVVLPALEVLLTRAEMPCAIIMHYGSLITPAGDAASLSVMDRTAAATLHRWSLWDEVVHNDNMVIMLCSTLSSLSQRLTRNPRIVAIKVPLPAGLERARFLSHAHSGLSEERGSGLVRLTAGLQLRQVDDLMKSGTLTEGPDDSLPVEQVAARKKEILEQECHGLIEVINPDHDFTVVGGLEPIKQGLMRIVDHVKAGRRAQVPMGVMLVGPMGTGKSFIAEAFARESGLAAIKLKNFRDKWVGSTEANLEKVLGVIESLGEILVIIDEGDRAMGGDEGDSGVNSRVMARLKEFMSDPDHRGRIIFMMMTNRPDKLDTDMKRPGRFDTKIPFFRPQSSTERAAIVRAQIRRHKLKVDLPDEVLLPILEDLHDYGAADLEALLLMAWDDLHAGLNPNADQTDEQATEEAADTLTGPYLAQAARDYLPTRETAMMEYMELLAVQEASSRRWLPGAYRDISMQTLHERLEHARGRALR